MLQSFLSFLSRHKFAAAIIGISLIASGYYGYKALKGGTAEVRYVLAAVEKGTLITSVSGSGQISASNQVDIKAKSSGDIVFMNAKSGQEVKSGVLLFQLDSADETKAVRDAKTSLETAKLELDELLKPVDELTLLQAENSLTQLKESKLAAEDDLEKSYESGLNSVVSAFFDLPTIISDIDGILHNKEIVKSQENIDAYADMIRNYEETKVVLYRNSAAKSYASARVAYDENFQDYKSVNRNSDNAAIEALLDETYETAKKLSDSVKDADNLISFVKDTLVKLGLSVSSVISAHQTTVRTDTSKINSILSSLLSAQQAIKNNRDTIVKSERSIKEKELSLADLKAGADELSVRAKRIAIQQKEDALATAQQSLADCYVRAPFNGVIAKVNVKKGDTASSGTALATIITKQRIAEISLNEVDVAKVKMGQKVTLTFDAVEGLSIAGEVADVDTIGTVSQGVVTYNIKISFDTQDDRVKPGMSASAAIITDVKQDALLVPNSAVKEQGGASYVQAVDEKISDPSTVSSGQSNRLKTAQSTGITLLSSPHSVLVEAGVSNDTMTEILSGLKEGDYIVVRTVDSSTTQKSSQSQGSSGLRIPGMPGGGGFGR